MASSNVEAHRAAHDAWNRRDFDAVVSRIAPTIDFFDHARKQQLTTPGEFKQWVTLWAEMFSDGRITDTTYLDAGDTVVAQFVARGTYDGPVGPFPVRHAELSFEFCEIFHFDESGMIVGGDSYYDQLSMYRHLGHIDFPAPTEA